MSWIEITLRSIVIFIGFWMAIQCAEHFSWMCTENQYVTRLERFNSFVLGIIMFSLGLAIMALGLFL